MGKKNSLPSLGELILYENTKKLFLLEEKNKQKRTNIMKEIIAINTVRIIYS